MDRRFERMMGTGETVNGPWMDRRGWCFWRVGQGPGTRLPMRTVPASFRTCGNVAEQASSARAREVSADDAGRMVKTWAKRVAAKVPGKAFSPAQKSVDVEEKKVQGSGRGGTKRKGRKRDVNSAIKCITKSDIRRLARRAGVQRVSLSFYDVARKELKRYLRQILPDIAIYTEHAQRVTVLPIDVLRALKRRGQTLYGFWPGAENLMGAVPSRHKRLQKVKTPLRKPVVSPVKAFQLSDGDHMDIHGECMDAERLQRLQVLIASYFLEEHVDSCPLAALVLHVQRSEPVTEGELEAVVTALQDENRVMYLNKTVWLI